MKTIIVPCQKHIVLLAWQSVSVSLMVLDLHSFSEKEAHV